MWKSRARPRGQPGGKPLSEDCAAHLSDAFPAAFTVLPQDYVLVKPRFSAFFHTGLDLILRRLGVQTVLLAGTTTPNCIRTTCYDAISLDYDAVVLSDCTSSVTDARAGGEPRRYAARGRPSSVQARSSRSRKAATGR